jgi:hypothetical protein
MYAEVAANTAVAANAALVAFKPMDFISADVLGTETQACCAACPNCKEFKFRVDFVSFKEDKEYKAILND